MQTCIEPPCSGEGSIPIPPALQMEMETLPALKEGPGISKYERARLGMACTTQTRNPTRGQLEERDLGISAPRAGLSMFFSPSVPEFTR